MSFTTGHWRGTMRCRLFSLLHFDPGGPIARVGKSPRGQRCGRIGAVLQLHPEELTG
jgi:hypothetical protein